ncbi:MAG: YdcF family protein [Pseudomonadota bacterium]
MAHHHEIADALPAETGRNWSKPALFSLALLAFLMCAGALSFSRYVDAVGALDVPNKPSADGMVVVTGGQGRIEAAMHLLESGAAKRLLISGVHQNTNASTLVARTNGDAATFECCVDLDFAALDTAGNAREAAKWLSDNQFSSALVVTSSYHVPRTLAELSALAPQVELIAYPVEPAFNQGRSDASSLHGWPIPLLAREYVKLTISQIRRLLTA